MRKFKAVALVGVVLLAAGLQAQAEERLVHDPAAFAEAVGGLQPGDTLVLADGEWRDFQVLFSGKGTADRPITLTAQTPGKVVLTGRSNLRMAGEHLVVSNLVFRDGWSPTGEVFSFRRTPKARANHSRATGIVIDRFNNPDRRQSDHWVALYGRHNRFDHGHLVGKSNAGTTMVVVRDERQGLDNRHRIDHNWFGPRPNLGSNGGETLRVGTSHDSLSDSHTVVEDNWFERCDGEVEIVSNKSGGNVYRRNVFHRSQGALVLRHGDGNLVEDNVFLGGGKPHTGGVRVINRRQTVRNNHFQGLRGDGFASALSVMYGVPDSPLNRYVQVDGAVIEGNTFVDVDSILFGTGMDEERSLAPVNSRFEKNLIVGDTDPVEVLGDPSGIAFAGNVQSPAASPHLPGGVQGRRVDMRRAATGLQVPAAPLEAGARPALRPIPRDEVGVPWYPKEATEPGLDTGATLQVEPGEGTLSRAVARSSAGDRIALAPGRHLVDEVLPVAHPLTIAGPASGGATIAFSRSVLFEIARGGSLKLENVAVVGSAAPDQAGNAVIRTRPGSGAANYALVLENVGISGLEVNRAFDVIALGKDTLADAVTLRRVEVDGITGSVLAAASETDDRGTYNAERVTIVDSHFSRVGGPAVDLYRGGTDESTFGPELRIARSRFDRVGGGDVPSLRLHGVQRAELIGNAFERSGGVRFVRTVGEPVLLASDNRFADSPGIASDVPAGAVR
ncbi:chondroitinase-B domain-containing protein [Luteimonas sp. R10]|uniref:chondroitinase-B domain-containing protein n=1 Tax=Luteimonas sp. R10 TaxID=3108176 RepID=UPI00308D63FB|nr:polysaccharide lyase 6 family protein [Luteimonas sp. R10]